MRGHAKRLRLPPADARVTRVGEIRPMPRPANAVALAPEVERFLERLSSLPTIAWLVAAEEFGVARQSTAPHPLGRTRSW